MAAVTHLGGQVGDECCVFVETNLAHGAHGAEQQSGIRAAATRLTNTIGCLILGTLESKLRTGIERASVALASQVVFENLERFCQDFEDQFHVVTQVQSLAVQDP